MTLCYHACMKIESAEFIKGVVGPDETLERSIPQIAFIGRSNVGKSSVINSLTHQKGLARASSFPGRTQEINLFLINKNTYFIDLPGYGFARASHETRERIQELIFWYLFESEYQQKVVALLIDANVGLTEDDKETLRSLEEHEKNIVIVANKVDKIKKSEHKKQLQKIQDIVGQHKIIPYSSEKKLGVNELTDVLLK